MSSLQIAAVDYYLLLRLYHIENSRHRAVRVTPKTIFTLYIHIGTGKIETDKYLGHRDVTIHTEFLMF